MCWEGDLSLPVGKKERRLAMRSCFLLAQLSFIWVLEMDLRWFLLVLAEFP
jgi:hypothetical protein